MINGIEIFFIYNIKENVFNIMFNPALITLIIILSLIFLVIAIILGIKAHKAAVTTGVEGLTGMEAVALEDFKEDHKGTKGSVLVYGEIWTGVSEDDIQKDDIVTITAVNGMKLSVKKNK